jgi:hypothetical protein
MANGQIKKLLDFANQQMAAEAFLSQAGDRIPNRPDEADVNQRLRDGNTGDVPEFVERMS